MPPINDPQLPLKASVEERASERRLPHPIQALPNLVRHAGLLLQRKGEPASERVQTNGNNVNPFLPDFPDPTQDEEG